MFLTVITTFIVLVNSMSISRNFFALNTKAMETTELMTSLWSKGGREYGWGLVHD
jgi:hypothetical protein